MRGKKGGRGKPNEGQREETGTTERDEREERQRERERERKGKTLLEEWSKPTNLLTLKAGCNAALLEALSWLYDPGPLQLPLPLFPLGRLPLPSLTPTSQTNPYPIARIHDAQLIIFFEASWLIDWPL